MVGISVALATYNGARHLPEQLASIAGQTRRPDELIVSDDGSSDDTLDVVRKFAEDAPFPVTLLHEHERLGFADNFLRAAANCRYGFVAFCDQDDVWLPRKLELGAARLAQDGSLLSMHTLTVTDELLRPIGFEWDQGIKADRRVEPFVLDTFGTGWGNTMMFRRELATAVPASARPVQPFGTSRRLSHDTWIYTLASALGRVSQIASPLILYRQHSAAATEAAKPRKRSRLAAVLQVPIAEYRERARIDGQMAPLMERLAAEGGSYAAEARRAGDAFAARHARWAARVGIFDGETIAVRRRAYRSHQKLAGPERPWIGSRAKDLVLGVAGLGGPSLRGSRKQ